MSLDLELEPRPAPPPGLDRAAARRLARHAARALADPKAGRREKALARGALALIDALEGRPDPPAAGRPAAGGEGGGRERMFRRGGADAVNEWFRQIFGVEVSGADDLDPAHALAKPLPL
jgi:hypothetical protein